jgi:large subunit ribosomal protein L18
MITNIDKNINRTARRRRVRGKISGTPGMPRLSVYRSSQHIYAQVIDDTTGKTLAASSTVAKGLVLSGTKSDEAGLVGQDLAAKALKAGCSSVVFDRGGYLYIGRVKALAEGARKGGLQF